MLSRRVPPLRSRPGLPGRFVVSMVPQRPVDVQPPATSRFPRQLHQVTPFFKSVPLSEALSKPVWIKMDALQPSGSFKLRGVGYACQRAAESGASQLVSSSGGNAGLAVAYVGQQLGLPVTVVLPDTTPAFIHERLRGYGANVIVKGAQWSEANAEAETLAERTGGVLIHPFDHPDLWAGHATVVHEVFEALEGNPPGAIVGSVGGGGLVLGLLQGLREVKWNDKVLCLACETEGANALALSVEAKTQVHLSAITSLAKSLGSPYPSQTLLDQCLKEPTMIKPWVCSDQQAVAACVKFAEDHRVLVEPACGAALAAVYNRCPELDSADSVVVEVCGGAIATPSMIESWKRECGL